MTFTLDEKSLKELDGVHEDLVHVVKSAAVISTVGYVVYGPCTAQEQNELFLRGASKMDGRKKLSRQQTGHGVLLMPLVAGRIRAEKALSFHIAEAVRKAARQFSVVIRWGGIRRRITDEGDKGLTIEQLFLRSPAWDFHLYELPESHYPPERVEAAA